MSDPAAVRLASRLRPRPRPSAAGTAPGGAGHRWWRPAWSVPAAIRAARATVVVPGLFAICLKVIGDEQMTLFAVFGGFGGLIFSSFGGTRRDKAVAYLSLAVVGSVALIIGTLVSTTIWLAALVTIPVAFAIFFAGVTGPNLASGVTASLLAYVLPVATAAPASAIGSRLEGWWLAMAAATVAVLLVSPKSPGDKLRASAAAAARAMARQLSRSVAGSATQADWDAVQAAKDRLLNDFGSTPLRPTGLATADQGLANVVELLEWCAGLLADALDGQHDFSHAAAPDLELLSAAAGILAAVADLLDGQDAMPDLDRLAKARRASAAHQRNLSGEPDRVRASVAHAAHAQVIAVAARAAVFDAIIAARRAGPELIAVERRRWSGQRAAARAGRLPALATDTRFLARHASIRSVWFRNSLRGAVALAAAVAVADLTGVQHGFWVVLGTLSVLRSTAAATGSTALRALGGTAVGFAVGAALVLAIGTGPTALWVALPIAVLVAGYAPGTAPFAVGQAAFTITVVVIFNLLVPVGWTVGLLRIEDVALGTAVSVIVGLLFWPRGAGGIVGTDLADAFRRGAAYLAEAVDWALGVRTAPPDTAVAAISAGVRLDEALRAYLTEQGAKRMAKEDLWHLVMGATRLRLTAYSVASLHDRDGDAGPAAGNGGPADGTRSEFQHLAMQLVGFYEQIADQVSGSVRGAVQPARLPDLAGPDLPVGVACTASTPPDYPPDLLWVGEYLYHLGTRAQSVSGPAAQIAMLRQRPWWR
jgi:fusaric acid resistance family protein